MSYGTVVSCDLEPGISLTIWPGKFQVQACGSLVTEEQPNAMLIPLEYFLMGFGFYRQSQMSASPRSPLSPSCISPELLSPESMGLKLKPIKTRISLEV